MVEPLDDDPADESLLGLDMREVPGALILTVTGEIDVLTTPRLRAAVSKCLDRADELLVVDLTEVSFLGSHGLAALVGAAQESATGPKKAPLRLVVDENRPVVRPLEVTGLDDVLALYNSVDDALV